VRLQRRAAAGFRKATTETYIRKFHPLLPACEGITTFHRHLEDAPGSAQDRPLSAGSGRISFFHISGGGMASWGLSRLWFWILVAVYFAIEIPLGYYTLAHLEGPPNFPAKLDTLLVIALAFAIGARLNDAGLNRWIGIGATFLITVILPAVLLLGYIAAFGESPGASASKEDFMELFGMVAVVPLPLVLLTALPLVLLIALLIWAGTRPGRPAPQVSAAAK
jgi:hypothetical protein